MDQDTDIPSFVKCQVKCHYLVVCEAFAVLELKRKKKKKRKEKGKLPGQAPVDHRKMEN